MKDDYNPFDEENIRKQKIKFGFVFLFIVISSITVYFLWNYQLYPQERELYTDDFHGFVVPHGTCNNSFDIIVKDRFNNTSIIDNLNKLGANIDHNGSYFRVEVSNGHDTWTSESMSWNYMLENNLVNENGTANVCELYNYIKEQCPIFLVNGWIAKFQAYY